MLTIISAIVGLLGSIAPGIINLFQQKQTQEFDLEIAKINVESAAAQTAATTFSDVVKADASDRISVRNDDIATVTTSKFLLNLKASIRPVVTYLFFILFLAVKSSSAYVMLKSGTSVPDMLAAVWDTDTASLFSTIMAFWFGTRVLEKYGYFNKPSSRINIPPAPSISTAPPEGGQVIGDVQALPQYGEKSDAVTTLQNALVNKGQTLSVDGDFGDETKTAISAFQKSVGLPPTGQLDNATYNHLMP